jgi:hypothetical protein
MKQKIIPLNIILAVGMFVFILVLSCRTKTKDTDSGTVQTENPAREEQASLWLGPLVVAECLENKGRFIPTIEMVLRELIRNVVDPHCYA